MKFHYLGQQLLDSNCLLLVMKMFGMQDLSMVVVSKCELPELKCVIPFLVHPSFVTLTNRVPLKVSSAIASNISPRTPKPPVWRRT